MLIHQGAMLGYPIMDPIGALIVAGIIYQIGYKMTAESAYQLLDRLTPHQVQQVTEMKAIVEKQLGLILITIDVFCFRVILPLCFSPQLRVFRQGLVCGSATPPSSDGEH